MKAFMLALIAVLMFGMLLADTDPMGFIKGIVVDEDSIGLQYANLKCSNSDKFISGALSDKNGRYLITIPRGDYTLRATLIGYSWKDSLMVSVIPEDTLEIMPIQMLRSGWITVPAFIAPVGKIIVRVKDTQNRPLEGVQVEFPLKDYKKTLATNQTNIDGLSRFSYLKPGFYNMKFIIDGYKPLKMKVEVIGNQTIYLEAIMKRKRDK